jgi:hypothetical protein
MFGLLALLLANMFIMNGVQCITLEIPVIEYRMDARRKCMKHGGFQWA